MNKRRSQPAELADGGIMTMPDQSQIRQSQSHRADTVREAQRSDAEVSMPTSTAPTGGQIHLHVQGLTTNAAQRYLAPMTVSANTVIAAIDHERPGLSETKRDLLLFFCQGHHLDHRDTPLFAEPMHATPTGVTVTLDPLAGVGDLNHPSLNTVSYVLSRYANLSPTDLRTLIQASLPWQLARDAGDDHRIEWVWLTDWFRRPEEQNDPDDDRPTAGMVAAFMAKRAAN